jgi:hypothetical protein
MLIPNANIFSSHSYTTKRISKNGEQDQWA